MLYAITSKCERYNVLYKCRKENQTMKINVIILHEDAFVAPSVEMHLYEGRWILIVLVLISIVIENYC